MSETFRIGQDPRGEEAREAANAWVARFAPLVMAEGPLEPSQIMRKLDVVAELTAEAGEVRRNLMAVASSDDRELEQTLKRAIHQLPSIEQDLRRQLARQEPGHPLGIADFDRLQEKLDEREARQEIGERTDLEVPAVLERRVSSGSIGAAATLGIFGLGWTAFTTLHAFLMIGGMSQSVGLGALALLLFYGIFWTVGFAMLGGAWSALATEDMKLDGTKLLLRRSGLGLTITKQYSLDPTFECTVLRTDRSQGSSIKPQVGGGTQHLVLHDKDGKGITFGGQASSIQREQLLREINAYLRAYRA